MLRYIFISLIASLTLASVAQADVGLASEHAKVLARLSGYFKYLQYTGVNTKGDYCRVDVSRMGFPANPSQIFLTGYDRYPMPQPGNSILRQSGFFQLGSLPKWFIIREATFTDEMAKVTIYVPNATDPIIYGISEWTGTLVLRPSRNGRGLGSIEMTETTYDPNSNMSSTRHYFCGERSGN